MIDPTVETLTRLLNSIDRKKDESLTTTNKLKIIPARDLGFGTPLQMADRFISIYQSFIDELNAEPPKRLQETQKDTHKRNLVLVGHSTGGIIARALANRPELNQKISKVITIGTPHLGAAPADQALYEMSENSLYARSLKLIGYDLKLRSEVFHSLSTQGMQQFNQTTPPRDDIEYHSLLCQVPFKDRGLGLLWWRGLGSSVPKKSQLGFSFRDSANDGDGFISLESQTFGKPSEPFYCDHLDSMGLHSHWRLKTRRNRQAEFQRMMKFVLQLAFD
jgi:pimeloyl-ACP methyl ester carboxylesterase